MTDVRKWLDSIGLGQYGDAFEENAIEVSQLPELDHEVLSAVGVKAAGHRMKILKAAAELASQSVHVEAGEAASASLANASPPAGEAERRQLTVMFCDLVDSVALGESMELEDYRELLSRFRTATTHAVERFGGFIARHQGDGLLVYFGYPQAHESDAEHAVRAALDVLREVVGLTSDDNGPQVRVGVATGATIVGDVLPTDASQQPELAAFGSTPNLAARLQSQAMPNQALVSDTTQNLTNDRFEYEQTVLELKGIESNVLAYRLVGEKSAASRLDVTSGRRLTPLVGRQEELALLQRRWQQAMEGAGQVALICAEPGVGKTRMMMEVHRRFGDADAETILLFCSPYHTGTSFYPVADYLSRTLQLAHSADPQERLRGLEHWLDSLTLSAERFVPLLAPLLSLDLAGRYPRINLDGAERQRRTITALVDMVVAHAQRRPVLLAVEDLHWVDSTTRDFLGLLIEAIREQHVFVLVTYRPEIAAPWSNQRHLTALTLNHLTGVECRELVRGLDAGQALTDELVEQIVNRTDGVPLFVEELLRTVLEAGAGSGDAIPETLRDALTARLDRLGEAKRVAQLASVIGRVFPLPLLLAASRTDTNALQANLERLVSSGLAYRRTLTGGEEYAFKHALIRDCAYQSLLRDERKELHQRVAQALEELADGRSAPAELIARHFTDGGEPERALPFWRQAGEEAEARGAYTEALVHFDAAMASVDEQALPADAILRLALGRARCQHFLGQRAEALDALSGYSSLLDDVGDLRLAGRFFVFLGRMQAFQGLHEQSLESLERAVLAANSCGDGVTEGNAYAWLGRHCFQTGKVSAAVEHHEKALQLLRAEGPSWDLGEAYMRYGMLFCMHTHEFNRALTVADELASIAEHLDDDRVRTNSLLVRGMATLMLGDWPAAERACTQAMTLAPNEYERVFSKGFLAAFYLETGNAEAALPLIEDELKGSGQYRSQQVRCWGIYRLAETYRLLDRLDDARVQAETALSLANELSNTLSVIEATKTLGLIAHDEGDLKSASAQFRHALAIAQAGYGPLVTGQCRLGLAEVLFDVDDVANAADVLLAAKDDFVKCGARKYIERAQNLAAKHNVALPR